MGEPISLRVRPDRSGYLSVLALADDGEATLLYPNSYAGGRQVEGGHEIALPDPRAGDDWLIRAVEPGRDLVVAVVTQTPLPLLEPLTGAGGQRKGYAVVPGKDVGRLVEELVGAVRGGAPEAKRLRVEGGYRVPPNGWAAATLILQVD